MNRNFLSLLARVCVGLLLLLVGLSPILPGAGAQGSVMEVEPNDSRDQAQLVDLVAGGSVNVEGSVARGDGGSLVAELKRLEKVLFARASATDVMEDWYAIDVDGALELSIELDWPTASDLDTWTLAGISPAVFPDRVVSHNFAASTAEPEREPNGTEAEPADTRLYYPYADRSNEVIDAPMNVPDRSRYFITVSNFNDGVSPPTSYTLRLASPAPGTTRTVLFDTSGPGLFGAVFPSDLGADRLLAVQRITPAEYPARLDRVELLQFSPGRIDLPGEPSQLGAPLELVVLVDAAGTGNPANATEVLRQPVRIEALDAVNSYPVEGPDIIVQSGDIYAGFEMVEQANVLHLPFDIDKAGFGRSYISTDRGLSFDQLATLSSDVEIALVANAGINAILTINPAQAVVKNESRNVLVRKTSSAATREMKVSIVKLQ